MPVKVAVVTDSAACLPPDGAARDQIHVVPLRVVIGDEVHDETAGAPIDVPAAMRRGVPVTTSRPAPERFAHVYERAAASGAAGIASIHVSSAMSGTLDSARMAAASSPVPVVVVDSRSIAAGLGLAVLAAADAARAGLSLAEVAEAAAARGAHQRSLFCVTTLQHLQAGGRVSARSVPGAPLGVKPIMHVVDGRIVLLEKARTLTRAVARLEDLAAVAAGSAGTPADVIVQHLACAQPAERLAGRLGERVTGLRRLHVIELGPVIAAHTGPGLLGVVVAPA